MIGRCVPDLGMSWMFCFRVAPDPDPLMVRPGRVRVQAVVTDWAWLISRQLLPEVARLVPRDTAACHVVQQNIK